MNTGTSESAPDSQSDALAPAAQPVTDGNGTGRDLETVECAACGHVGTPVGAGQCGQCRAFVKANTAGLVHGARSEALRRRLEEEAAEALAERRQAIAEDLGGAEALTVIGSDIVDRYVTAAALLEWMERRLLAEGCLTGKGRRRALHGAYLAQLDRVMRLTTQLEAAAPPERDVSPKRQWEAHRP